MEIDKETAERLMQDSRNLAVSRPDVTFLRSHPGPSSRKSIPPTLRTIIGVAGHLDTVPNVSKAFNVSVPTVTRAKDGNIGPNRHDPEMKKTIDEVVKEAKTDLREQALSRLSAMFADVITEANLCVMKPREAVSAARDIATIVDKLTPRAGGANVAVFVHTPRVKSEEEYGEVVEVTYRPTEERKLT